MAFNFNWSPLIADTSRARDMLTTALNKSPKPPIIVDDIIVTELNLGSIPPELEILEIGDLAEDKFRGIFKLTYTGDAFLTLKTRVQANPLNTYLSTVPTFASPQPLAASSGLTIPLQITLSDIRLSGFVILVFSKQKGITLVFRNDPLESLKVSSTFDSIPFVRDYLQKEIEGQLRILFMEDLPAIIHRLSLRLWSPDHQNQDENDVRDHLHDANQAAEKPINPFASPPSDPFDAFGRPLDEQDLASLSYDLRSDTHATFSQKNLLRLATLTDSHRTLSLFTPPIQDAVFRAWAGAAEREEIAGVSPSMFTLASLSRHNSIGSSAGGSLYSYSETSPVATLPSRPSMSALSSAYAGSSAGQSRPRTHNGRKRRTRVIDLRKEKTKAEVDQTEDSSRPTTPASTATSSQNVTGSIEREGELVTPPVSPEKFKDKTPVARKVQGPEIVSPRPQPPPTTKKLQNIMLNTSSNNDGASSRDVVESPVEVPSLIARPRLTLSSNSQSSNLYLAEKEQSASTYTPLPYSGSILEQAWMMKMANEIASRVQAEREKAAAMAASGVAAATESSSQGGAYKHKEGSLWSHETGDESPPPAYAA